MTKVECDRKQCLNNKYGICTAREIVYKGWCMDYITTGKASKNKCGICRRVNGKLKRNTNPVLK